MRTLHRLLGRRTFLRASAAVVTGVLAGRAVEAHEPPAASPPVTPPPATSPPVGSSPPVVTPDLARLPFDRDGDVKVFRLVAEPVKQEVLPGRVLDLWGYNGSAPGPSFEVNEGDRVRVLFENRLPEPTTLHWHGLEVPIEMDGVPAISQPEVEPGGRFTYEFTLHQHGTFFYHSHGAMQEMMGMLGLFVVHPRVPYEPAVQRDFGIVLQEYSVLPSNTVPNSLAMEFNWLTFNGKVSPAVTPLLVRLGERVRIRLVNIGMDHHPVHLHGHQFEVTGTEAGRIPQRLWYPQNTVLVGVAQARAIEFDAKYPGDWMLHCHLPHHMMNQMASMVGPLGRTGAGPRPGGVQEGLGVIRRGHALSDDLGPKLGRGLGVGSEGERPTSPAVKPGGARADAGSGAPATGAHAGHGAPPTAAARRVPGFPQDMLMPMDDAVAKPETHGLARNWTGAMQGMMTLVRVLPPERYDEIMQRIAEARQAPGRPPARQEHRH